MNNSWVGCRWVDLKEHLEEQEQPYKLIMYTPNRNRFALSKVFRIIDVSFTKECVCVLISPEQAPVLM